MTLYRVTWEIDLDAESPKDAAERARAIQQSTDPENIAHVYRVQCREDVAGAFTCGADGCPCDVRKPGECDVCGGLHDVPARADEVLVDLDEVI